MEVYDHILAEHYSRGQLYIPVGLPGCGKSSYANQFRWATRGDLVVVSTDKIREFLGDVNDMSQNKRVFQTFHDRIDYHLKEHRVVFADATNLTREARVQLNDIARYRRADTHLVFFKNPDEAVARNTQRERVVPSNVMDDMLRKYERSLLEIPQELYTTVTEIRSIR